MATTSPETQVEAPKAVLNYDLRGCLGDVDLPVLLVHGDRDRSVVAAHVRALLRELPRGRLVTYERAGHFLVLERAARLAADVDAFAAGRCGDLQP